MYGLIGIRKKPFVRKKYGFNNENTLTVFGYLNQTCSNGFISVYRGKRAVVRAF
jgi:hypothetical protein